MPFSRYFRLDKLNHPWLFFNISRKQMQHFINKLSFWVLQPCHVATENQEGQGYKSKCLSTTSLLNIQGICQVSFLDFPTPRLPNILFTWEGWSVKPASGWDTLVSVAPLFAAQKTSSQQKKHPAVCVLLCQRDYLHTWHSCQEKPHISRFS